MSEKLHTPEPWKTVNGRNGNDCNVYGNEQENYPGTHSANGHSHSTFIAECEIAANARRIVACVNACRGISTEEIESGNLGKILAGRIFDEFPHSRANISKDGK